MGEGKEIMHNMYLTTVIPVHSKLEFSITIYMKLQKYTIIFVVHTRFAEYYI